MRLSLLSAFIVLAAVWSPAAYAQDHVVLAGRPTTKVQSDAAESIRSTLSPSESGEFRVEIVKRKGRYFWATREGRELSHSQSGVYHIFREATGPGYIRVVDQAAIPEPMRLPGPRIQYYEHMALGLVTITYWGTSDSFSP